MSHEVEINRIYDHLNEFETLAAFDPVQFVSLVAADSLKADSNILLNQALRKVVPQILSIEIVEFSYDCKCQQVLCDAPSIRLLTYCRQI